MSSLNRLNPGDDLAFHRYRAEKGTQKAIQRRRQRQFTLPKYGLGHVVEVLRKGKLTCAIIVGGPQRYRLSGRSKSVWRFLDCNGKEWVLESSKIVDVSSIYIRPSLPKHKILAALSEIDQKRQTLKQGIDLEPLWEMVAEADGSQREWSLAELAEIYFVDPPLSDQQAALLRALVEGQFFERRQTLFWPHSRSQVEKWQEQKKEAVEARNWIARAAKWLRSVADGHPQDPPAEAERIKQLMADKVLFGDQHSEGKLAAAISQHANFHRREAVFRTLVKLGYWSSDQNLDLLRHRIATSFSEPVLLESRSAQWIEAAKQSHRLWFRQVYALTDSSDLDVCSRAVSIRSGLFGFTVGVHLASPALMINPDGLVQKAAMDRAVALHLPDQSIPLLPGEITAQSALSWNQHRPCLTIQIRLNRQFEIQDYQFEICRVRLTHTLDMNPSQGNLRRLVRWTDDLRQQRIVSGAVVISGLEVYPRVMPDQADGSVEVSLERRDPDDLSAKIQQELSILANSLAAEYSLTHKLPAVFRADAPYAERHPMAEDGDPVASDRQRQAMVKATLQTQPAPHYGLGQSAYAPVTQANQRFTDLVMHQQIINHLYHRSSLHSELKLADILQYTVADREIGREIVRNADRYWTLKYLEERIDQPQMAVVLADLGNCYRVQLLETQLTALCSAHHQTKYAVGDQIQVRLVQVSARSNRLQLTSIV